MTIDEQIAQTRNEDSTARSPLPTVAEATRSAPPHDADVTSPSADELIAGLAATQAELHGAITHTAPTADAPQVTGATKTSDWQLTGENVSNLPRINGYEIRSKLGGGGMGEVFRAQDVALRTDVAIKCPKSLDEHSRALFLEEARQLAQVRHINVVAIRNFGECDGRVYFTMDLIDGPTGHKMIELLRDHHARQLSGAAILKLLGVDPSRISGELRRAASFRRPYFRMIAIWLAEAADGLAAAHVKKITHRDVKPHNFLLARDGRLMVTDFGLARDDRAILRDGAQGVAGTLPYVAPERIVGDWAPTDARADIWALGASLYEFLTFRRAYPNNTRQVLQDIASSDAATPRSILSAVPATLDAICVRAMARDRSSRYPTASELADALRRFALSASQNYLRGLVFVAATGAVAAGLALASPVFRTSSASRGDAPRVGAAAPAMQKMSVLASTVHLSTQSPVLVIGDVELRGEYADGRSERISADRCYFEAGERTAGVIRVSRKMLERIGPGECQVRVVHEGGLSAELQVKSEAETPTQLAAQGGAENNPTEPSKAPAPRSGLMLLANQNLNVDVEGSEQAGGVAQTILHERAVERFGDRVKLAPAPAGGLPWTHTSALEVARSSGSGHVALVSVKCRARRFEIRRGDVVVSEISERGPGWFARAIAISSGDTTCRIDWHVEVSAELIDVADGSLLWTHAIEDHVVRDYCAREFDGDLHKRLIRELWNDLAKESEPLLSRRDGEKP